MYSTSVKMWNKKKLVLFTLFAMNLIDQPAPEVTVEQGVLSGIISADGTILEYIGIPYGIANKTNRFKAPFPPEKWEGIYKATEEYNCPQIIDGFAFGTEDCLKLNVYVPAMIQKPVPVMVFIHGGGFLLGSGGKFMYGPEFIVKHGVILVNINYRIGALGFLCLGTEDAPGNAGLKDQVAALKWIKRNIAAFGGDPDNLTVFGESAGGASTSLLIATGANIGLFDKAIIQSGASIANWVVSRQPIKQAAVIAKAYGHDTQDPKELFDVLSKINPKDLVSNIISKKNELFLDSEIMLNLPCVENQIKGVEPFMTDLPFKLIQKMNNNSMSIMYGTNSREGYFLFKEEPNVKSIEKRNDKNYIIQSDLEFPSEAVGKVENDKIKKLYFGDGDIKLEKRLNISALYGHLYFEMPVLLETELMLASSKGPIYNYIFNYSGDRNFMKKRSGFLNETGASHADDLFYLFTSMLLPFPAKGNDLKIINKITSLWTNFAKYGNPTPFTTKDIPIRWTPNSLPNMTFLYIDNELQMGPMPNPKVFQVWKNLYSKYRRTDLKYFH